MIHILTLILGLVLSAELQTVLLECEGKENTEALLQTIYLQLELGVSESELVNNLEEIISDLKEQDQIAAALNANQKNVCEGSEAYQVRIDEIQKDIDSSLETLNLLRPELEILAGNIEKKETEIDQLSSEIQKSKEKREFEKEKWSESDKEIVESIEATIGAIRLTSQTKYDDPSLIFVQKKINSLIETISKAAETMDKYIYSPVITGLSQITNSDEQTINQVLELLESLKADLVQSKGESSKLEETNNKNYLEYVSSIETTIESNTQDINNLKNKKQRLEFTIETTEKELEEDKSRKEVFKDIFEGQKSLCADWEQLSQIENNERQNFIKKIYEVIELINTNISGVKEYFSKNS